MNIDYENKMNRQIFQRNIPDHQLKPLFDFRPQSTKYTHFQVVDKNTSNEVELLNYKEGGFNPGYRGNTDEYFKHIDKENGLRNQFMSLQRDNQAFYVPSSNSELYNNKMSYKKVNYSIYKPINTTNKLKKDLAPNLFHNSTRYYMKN